MKIQPELPPKWRVTGTDPFGELVDIGVFLSDADLSEAMPALQNVYTDVKVRRVKKSDR